MKKIMIVDDDRGLTRLIESFLTDNGFVTVVVNDAEAALEKLHHDMVDLLLLDVVMPKINGYAFLFEIKKIPAAAKLPVIVLTGKESMEELFKLEGVKEYLVKPFSNQVLLEKIQMHIGK